MPGNSTEFTWKNPRTGRRQQLFTVLGDQHRAFATTGAIQRQHRLCFLIHGVFMIAFAFHQHFPHCGALPTSDHDVVTTARLKPFA